MQMGIVTGNKGRDLKISELVEGVHLFDLSSVGSVEDENS